MRDGMICSVRKRQTLNQIKRVPLSLWQMTTQPNTAPVKGAE